MRIWYVLKSFLENSGDLSIARLVVDTYCLCVGDSRAEMPEEKAAMPAQSEVEGIRQPASKGQLIFNVIACLMTDVTTLQHVPVSW